eukprot:GHRR01004769.1.p1 GENE.GHRR01004769.1~~GHRR01004769.1.p1  ORF type:complete len:111 (+),score=39.75 GHRR01004769.1:716-1048(+)
MGDAGNRGAINRTEQRSNSTATAAAHAADASTLGSIGSLLYNVPSAALVLLLSISSNSMECECLHCCCALWVLIAYSIMRSIAKVVFLLQAPIRAAQFVYTVLVHSTGAL